MKKVFFLSLLATTILFYSSCNEEAGTAGSSDSFSLDSVRASIAASNAKYGESFATNDSAAFVAAYTSDACINPPNTEKICGSQGIGMFFSGGYQMGIRNIKLTTDEVMGGKEIVCETGKYEIMDSAGTVLDKGKFIVAWKEENGTWKMHRDVWNSDMPLPGTH